MEQFLISVCQIKLAESRDKLRAAKNYELPKKGRPEQCVLILPVSEEYGLQYKGYV